MPSPTFQAIRARLAGPSRALNNRLQAHRSRLGTRPLVAKTLPEPVRFGDAEAGQRLVAGEWRALGFEIPVGEEPIWTVRLPDARLEAERQAQSWLDDLGAFGNRAARALSQAWLLDWLRRYGHGSGPGWTPELAGRRAQAWTTHCRMLTEGLDRGGADRFWFGLAAQQRYLAHTWLDAPEGLPRLQALAGLVWSGVVLPHQGHRLALTELGLAAEAAVDLEGETPSRAPSDLADALILLIWTARLLGNAGQSAAPAHLAAIVRGVPILRLLRFGDGTLGRFHGGRACDSQEIDQALAELRIGVQPKPRLAMGYARLAAGRNTVLLDAAAPPVGPAPLTAHAGTLAFEFAAGSHPFVVNVGSGRSFPATTALEARQTAAHSTIEVDGRSSADLVTRGLAARTFGPRLDGGPSLVSIRQAQDATGQWVQASHDGYGPGFGLVHERRLFLDARGGELRGEDTLSVPDATARQRFDARARDGRLPFAARFHLHPDIEAAMDPDLDLVRLALLSGETWTFRCLGGSPELQPSQWLDQSLPAPRATRQVVVRGEVVEYLGQVVWSFTRAAEAPRS